MPDVELKTAERDGHIVVALRGELDVTCAAYAETAITTLVVPRRGLIIDVSALDFIDCSSLGALLRVQGLARRGGGDLVLAAPRPQLRRLLALNGMNDAFCVQASVAAAVAGASRPKRHLWRRLSVTAARPGRATSSRTGTR